MCLALVVAGLGSAPQAAAVEYELHGFAWRETMYSARTPWRAVADAFFSVHVREEAWLIRTVVSGMYGPRPLFIREVGSTNGQEIVESLWWLGSVPAWASRSNARPAFGQRHPAPSQPWPQASATIWSNTVPSDYTCDTFAADLWLMLAGGCYLLRQTNRELVPVYNGNVKGPLAMPAFKGLRVDADWRLGSEEPHLPLYVAYSNKRGMPVLDRHSNLVFIAPAPGCRQGCLEAFYGVTGTTNVGGLVLPTGFVSLRCNPSSLALFVRESVYVVVTNASARCSRTSLLPPLPVVRITDYRLLEAEPALAKMEYPALHLRRWPTVAESKRAYLAWQRKKQWEVQRAKPWQLAGFGLLLVAPVAWAWLHSRRPKPPH